MQITCFPKKITSSLIFACISIHKSAQTRLVLPWDVTYYYFIFTNFLPSFQTEHNKDFLFIGEGLQHPTALESSQPNTDITNELYRLDGITLPGPITIRNDSVWLYFFTDNNDQMKGWKLDWTAGRYFFTNFLRYAFTTRINNNHRFCNGLTVCSCRTPGGGGSDLIWMGVCCPSLETLTLF